MSMWIKLIFAMFWVLFTSVVYSQNITVVPSYIDLKMEDKNLSGSMVITNLKNESQRYRVMTTHWVLDQYNRLLQVKPTERSIVDWIKFNPKEFTIAPNESRTVRYTILKPEKELNGEYWGGIEFEPLEYKIIKTESTDSQKESTATIKVLSALMVPIFVEVGSVERRGSLEGIQIYQDSSNYIIGCVLKNQGNGALRLEGHCNIYDALKQKAASGKFGPVLVLPGCQIQHQAQLNGVLKPGNYSITANFADKNKTINIDGEGDFSIQ